MDRPPLPLVGDILPELTRVMTAARLVAYGGSTWDWHEMHHDTEAALRIGFQRPVVDGQMFGALLAQQVNKWTNLQYRIQSMSMRYRSAVHVGEMITVAGQVVAVDSQAEHIVIDIEQSVRCGTRVVVSPGSTRLIGKDQSHRH